MIQCSPPTKRIVQQPTMNLSVCPFGILVDTREQAPWTFQGIVLRGDQQVVRQHKQTLQTGDYSIAIGDYSIQSYAHHFTIERKSASDLVGSVTAGNARFRREHERMAEMIESGGFACVVIEGSMSAICEELDADDGRRASGNTILGVTASWPQKYGVPWFYAGDRRRAELLAFQIMHKWWEQNG